MRIADCQLRNLFSTAASGPATVRFQTANGMRIRNQDSRRRTLRGQLNVDRLGDLFLPEETGLTDEEQFNSHDFALVIQIHIAILRDWLRFRNLILRDDDIQRIGFLIVFNSHHGLKLDHRDHKKLRLLRNIRDLEPKSWERFERVDLSLRSIFPMIRRNRRFLGIFLPDLPPLHPLLGVLGEFKFHAQELSPRAEVVNDRIKVETRMEKKRIWLASLFGPAWMLTGRVHGASCSSGARGQDRFEERFQLTFDPIQAMFDRGEALFDHGKPLVKPLLQ